MTKDLKGKAAIAAGAIGSAAIAAALLYANKRRKKNTPTQPGPIPSGEKPETD
ncbi:isopropylmalate isomerase [Aurantiacibacter aquimixticola]|uniref:Isopropylmalate isomerase n=1 Tax=Aurantiacibacter aquimixticola TaxID=1958945 RepID=A0A419RT25_9SPHN|nr:isopropylmalate isomerase [Aurantiacibacter aquimixticola]RJY08953.1 isopropylmalate isomerase [Aurantiacibacter aquimixticola]